ncbi:UDP-N-acetylhexosamine pyrophosphorylase [Brachionus plicatilis]|uniref:UDP-N-acetylglucosamine diphosphorylase n=1 Tax=Brachionus plicatilis TaxID=10195 RepID=A0A3M7S2N2_BRAPC|nr:UDP-N-acetylhexosamine pyrophosphorylase [Brachionus plicatilis]
MMEKQQLESLLKPYGQEHLVKFWDELSMDQRQQLLSDINEINFDQVVSNFNKVKSEMGMTQKQVDSQIKPVPTEAKGSLENTDQIEDYELQGLKAIAQNQVAVLLLASGQGTRLGVSYPKGMYSVGLLSDKSLYQIQAERLLKIKKIADQNFPDLAAKCDQNSIPWYIMASEQTEKFFQTNNFFGLDRKSVQFFEQYQLPCLTNEGKVILDQKYKISKAPDGNGGLYRALYQRGILEDMKKRGVKYVHIYCVDNILVKMADPVFIGFCLSKDADCAAKVVKKVEAEEKVGVICKVNDQYQVVEYSEICEHTRNLRDEASGDLVYNAGNICNHFMSVDFLSGIHEREKQLAYHVAEKKIAFIDESGERILPKSNNGIKLEKFVFDVFTFSERFAIWEVPRDQEFSPLKNSDEAKKDCPATCRADLYAQHYTWLKNAGALFDHKMDYGGRVMFEISPLVSYNGEGLRQHVAGKMLKSPLRIELDQMDSIKFNDLDMDNYQKEDILMGA